MNYLIIALGGGIGSALRYAVSKFVQDSTNGAFPYHTFAVNIVGCLLIGLFYGLAARGHLGNNATTLLLTTGLCGGFTTFSTFCNENIALLRGDNAFVALVYVASSVFCGLLAVMLGYLIIENIN
ncbi:fluoride efflux transporter CrcB [Leyella stercorea]|uniref:fluoride efflux transporter CrcB n=1 Tax=Leyella stercorea TaxID=363265 RepID=UPI003AEFE503